LDIADSYIKINAITPKAIFIAFDQEADCWAFQSTILTIDFL